MAIKATFFPTAGLLSELGDGVDNTIVTSRDAAGQLFVNGGAVPINGGQATVANTSTIQVFGQGGNDTIALDESNGALPAAQLFGGAGNDTLIGGTGDDQVFGEAGNDRMIWNPGDGSDLFEGGDGTDTAEVNGGDDSITAGNGLAGLIKLTIDGGAGNDTIIGGDGNDTLIGGDGNDVIIGGRGNDTAQLGACDDTFIWNPGDGSDVVEGQDGTDTLVFNGSNVSEKISISANHGRVSLVRDVGNVTMDLNGVEHIQLNALGAADNITVNDLSGTGVTQVAIDLASPPGSGVGDLAADSVTVNATKGDDVIAVQGQGGSLTVAGLSEVVTISGSEATDALTVAGGNGNDTLSAATMLANTVLTLDGGAGNDTIIGSQGADLLLGGDGNDVVSGGRGNDTALLGNGNDTIVWNPGDGSDIVEGQAGTDTLVFNGANINENMDISANGQRVRLFRDVANITMDLDGVEHIQVNALGGADTITVNDLTGTDVTRVALDLSAPAGSGQGDGQPDTVIVNGTAGDDQINIASSGASVVVNGLAAQVTIAGAEGGKDSLVINALAGNDIINASALNAGQINLTINGGAGNDTITGSRGNDLVIGSTGNDVALLGAGDDTFVWNPGDGSDTVEGQAGTDTLLFNGSNVAENIDISANGSRARLARDVGNVTMDLNGVEHIEVNARGSADTVTVNDLTGTGVNQVAIDLGAQPGSPGGDGAADTIVINATNGDDAITIVNNNGIVTVSGLPEAVTISNFEANDRDRKSTRLNSSHEWISYAVFCLKKKITILSVQIVDEGTQNVMHLVQ